MQPIGFLCDHVEILYDIDIAFREMAKELGLKLWRAESLNDSATLVKALVEVVSGDYKATVDEVIVPSRSIGLSNEPDAEAQAFVFCGHFAGEMMKRVAIIGGGVAGLAATYELARLARDGAAVQGVLFEASTRLGGIVETVREGGFVIECGPDAWVSEKPWALELAKELGLADEVMPSNDADRKTYVLIDKKLQAMPDGMRMMVPADLDALDASELFSTEAKRAYRDEIGRAEELRANCACGRRECCGVCAAALWGGGSGEDRSSAAKRCVRRRCREAERTGSNGSICFDGTRAWKFDRRIAAARCKD